MTSILKLTPQEKTEHEVIHISIKPNVSHKLKHNDTLETFLLGFPLTFSRILENLIAGSLREINLSELFRIVFQKLPCN